MRRGINAVGHGRAWGGDHTCTRTVVPNRIRYLELTSVFLSAFERAVRDPAFAVWASDGMDVVRAAGGVPGGASGLTRARMLTLL